MLKLEACGFLAQRLCLTPIAVENGKGRGRKTSASLAKDARDQSLVAGNYRSETYVLNINSQKSLAEVKLCVCVAIPGGQWEITTFRTEQNATSLLFSVHSVQLASVITAHAKQKESDILTQEVRPSIETDSRWSQMLAVTENELEELF